jgi:hypothetical protein
MSKSDDEASEKVRDERQNDSVLDFLYHDVRRIGSFLGQFDDSGHLQEVRQSESAKKGHKRGFKITAGAGVPVVASGTLGFERTPHDTGEEGSERVYDPLWTNARTLLDYLEDAQMIQRDVTSARIGQFILASGRLSILNVAIMPKVWERPQIREGVISTTITNARNAVRQIAQQNTQALPAKARERLEKEAVRIAETNARGLLDLMVLFPASVQCTITGANFSLWSTLSEDGLITSASDLSLKHGTEIPGAWHLLGILDAQPSPIPPQIVIPPSTTPQHVGNTVTNLSNLGRQMAGRPENAYGATTLLLFREAFSLGS